MRLVALVVLLDARFLYERQVMHYSLLEALLFFDRRDTALSMALLHEPGQMPPLKIALLMVSYCFGPEKY
jgi:hypothetical protein